MVESPLVRKPGAGLAVAHAVPPALLRQLRPLPGHFDRRLPGLAHLVLRDEVSVGFAPLNEPEKGLSPRLS